MSAMTFTEDNCGTYPPSYPQRESLRRKGTTKIAHTQAKSKEKMPFMRIWHKWQMIYISKSV